MGDTLLLSDGLIVLDVERVAGSEIHTLVRIGGDLSNNKGINKLGRRLIGAGFNRQRRSRYRDGNAVRCRLRRNFVVEKSWH